MSTVDASAALAFGLAVTPLVVTPGAGFVLFSATMIERGRHAALAVAAGMVVGVMSVAALVVALAPLLARLDGVQRGVQVLGGLYLVYLGSRSLMRAPRGPSAETEREARSGRRDATAGLLAEGIACSVTNPGIFLIYLVILPSFLDARSSGPAAAAGLATVHLSVMTIWYAFLVVALARVSAVIREPRRQRLIGAVSALLLLALGVQALIG